MAEKSKEDRLSLTVVALVALVAIVSLAAIVLNVGGHAQAKNAQSTVSSNTAGLARGTVAMKTLGKPAGSVPLGGDCTNSKDCSQSGTTGVTGCCGGTCKILDTQTFKCP